jgi:DNA-binding MarR family transcriptional regulator
MSTAKKIPAAPQWQERDTRLIRLARLIYEAAQVRVYAGLAGEGFPEIRPAHSAVFRHIQPDGSRASELAQQAGITKQSMAYLVDSLATDGYLESLPDPTDGRARLVRLTTRGRKALSALERLSEALEREITQHLPTGQIEALKADLETIVAQFPQAAGNQLPPAQ